jgi:hypothetical protein
MVKNYILAGGFAVFCAGAVAHAQSTATPQQPQTQPSSTQQATTTVEGCVYREADIPGRSPNVAERAGVMEDYILVASSSAKGQGTVGTSGTTGTAGTSATATKMFKLEHADDEKLSALVGKRVRVTGKADAEHGDMKSPNTSRPTTTPPTTTPQSDRSMGPDKINLPEFEVATITEASGTCPSKPEIKK